MGSKGRIPPPHMRHPPPGPTIGHPEMFGPGILPPPVGLPPHERLPPHEMLPPHERLPPHEMLPQPEILERKLAAQHMEMERLATENQRLAATHGSLRQQLAAAQQDLQMLEGRIAAEKAEKEQNRRSLVERIANMEAELQAAEQLKLELQQARVEAQHLAESRLELLSKVQKMNADLQRAHVDVQQVPALLAELDRLRQEFHQYRATYEQERKAYLDHVESLQVMDKEYKSMSEEVAKLRAELNNTANADRRAVYGGAAGYGEDASGSNHIARSSYGDSYGASQLHATYQTSGAGPTAPVGAGGTAAVSGAGGTPSYGTPQSGSATARPPYDPSKVSPYNPQGVPIYNAQRPPTGYATAPYDMHRPPYDPQIASLGGYGMPQSLRGAAPPVVQPPTNVAHGLAAPPGAQARGGNVARR